MTEQEWLESCDGKAMINKAPDEPFSERKARLFAAACCRTVWQQLGPSGRKLTEVAEFYADEAPVDPVPIIGRMLNWVSNWPQRRRLDSLLRNAESEFGSSLLLWILRDMEYGPPFFAYMAADEANDAGISFVVQAQLVHDLFGNPFRPVKIAPAWLTTTVISLAQAIYDDRAFDRLPILADALEDAGCDQAELLAHCRGPGPHVRGCFAVDLLLKKE